MADLSTFDKVIKDPDFLALDSDGKKQVLDKFYNNVVVKDPSYIGLDDTEKQNVQTKYQRHVQNVLGMNNPPQKSIAQSAKENIEQGLSGINTMIGKGLTQAVNVVNPIPSQNTLVQLGKGLYDEYKRGGITEDAWNTLKAFVVPPVQDAAELSEKVMSGDFKGAGESVLRRPFDYLMDATMFYGGGGKSLAKGAEVAEKGMAKSSERAINSLIKPRDRQFAYGKNPGRGVANEGIVATSMEDLANKVSAKKEEIGNKIGEVVSSDKFKNVKQDFSNVVKPIDDAIAKVSEYSQPNEALLNRLEQHKQAISGIGPNGLPKYNLSSMTPKEAYDLKKRIGDNTKFTGAMSDDSIVNKALKQAYGNIDRRLDTLSPELKNLNERYADILGADVAVKHREVIANRSDIFGLTGAVMGAGTGAIFGGPHGAAMGGGAVIGTNLLYKIASSTPAKTALAQALSKGADISEAIKIAAKKLPVTSETSALGPLGVYARNKQNAKE